MSPCKTRYGFTLIELLIVVAIIAILAAIAIPNFLMAQVRAKVATSKANQASLATALEAYCVDNNDYPPDQYPDIYQGNYGGVITMFLLTTPVAYMTSIPQDPFNLNVPSGDPDATQDYYINLYHDYWYFGPETIDYWSNFATGVIPTFNSFGTNVSVGGWVLVGNGPLGYFASLEFPYDPTNGTVSYGNINRAGP